MIIQKLVRNKSYAFLIHENVFIMQCEMNLLIFLVSTFYYFIIINLKGGLDRKLTFDML